MTPETALKLYTQTPRQELRAIVALGQHLNVDEIGLLASKNRLSLEKYTHLFPELPTLYTHLNQRRNIFLGDTDLFIRYLSYHTLTPELSAVHKKILTTHRILRRQIYKFIKIVLNLKEKGLIKTEKPNPDKTSLHYKAAQELAGRLIRLWFINEVVLFGSVAKGDHHPESDIDLCLGIIPKRIPTPLYRIINCLANHVQEKYAASTGTDTGMEKLGFFDFLRDNKIFREMGFLEAGCRLAREDSYSFELDEGRYIFKKAEVAGYSINEYRNNFYTVVLYPGDGGDAGETGNGAGEEDRYRAVFIVACDAVALYGVTVQRRKEGNEHKEGYRVEAELVDSHLALLRKYMLEEKVLKCLASELIRTGVKRIYRGVTVV